MPPMLRFGLLSSTPRTARSLIEAGLSAALGEPCTVLAVSSYAALVDGLSDADVDLAWLPPVAYLRARKARAANLIATIERGGRASYGCALLGRASVCTSIDAVAKKRALWTDPWSAAGYLVPRAMLAKHGLDPDQLFSSQGFVGGYDAVLAALRSGQADVGAIFCRLDDQGRSTGGPWQGDAALSLLEVDGPIPGDSVCAGRALDEARRIELQGALTGPIQPVDLLKGLEATALLAPNTGLYDAFESRFAGRFTRAI